MLAPVISWRPAPALQLFLAWLFGASLLLAQLLLGVIRRRRLARTATDLLPAAWERSRARLRARGLFPERVRLYATPRSSMPMTWGIVRPVVLLPAQSDWTSDERDAALLHELAHVRRGDALWLTVLSLVRALHWYNPLAWWLCAAERLAREEACDDLVLRAGVRPSAYAEQLLGIVRQPNEWRTPAAALAMARPASLTRRLRAILRAEQPRELPGAAMRVLSVGALMLSVACIGTASPVRRVSQAATPDAAPSRAGESLGGGSARQPLVQDVDARAPRSSGSVESGATAATPAMFGDGVAFGGSAALAGEASGSSEAHVAGSAARSIEAQSAFAASAVGGGASANDRAASPLGSGASSLGSGYRYDFSTPSAAVDTRQQDCSATRSRKTSSSHSTNSEGRTETISWSRNGCRIEVNARGEYTLAPTLDDLRSLSRGGSFVLREDNGRVEREVRITSSADGTLEHRYRVDGETRPWDTEGKRWFAQVALRLDRATAWAVDVRFPALMSRGGVDAVLAEIDLLEGDYARRLYFTRLASSAQLSSAQLVRVIDSAASKIQSDYEMAELLIAASKQKAFDDPAQLSLARAASRIKSDYEKRRAFTALLSKNGLSPATFGEILAGTKGMDSDYELAELLITMNKSVGKDRGLALALLDAAGHLDSDYEHGRVLKDLVAQGPDTEVVTQLLKQVPRVGSAYERAEVLLAVARAYRIEGALRDPYVDAARSIDSEYERNRALAAAVGRRVER